MAGAEESRITAIVESERRSKFHNHTTSGERTDVAALFWWSDVVL